MTQDADHAPRITARGLGLFALGYLALALFYRGTITWMGELGSVAEFARSMLGQLHSAALDYGLKALLTLPVWWLVVRQLDGRPRAQVAAHVVLGPVWVWAWFWGYRAVAPAFGMSPLSGFMVAWDVYIPALVYAVQFGAIHGARFVSEIRRQSQARVALAERQAALELAEQQARAAAKEAQLAALRAQMDPHFLFNTLNTVAASVPAEQGATQDLVARLAGLVRYTLAAAQRERVLLREELEFVRDYLALEQERMGARLAVEIDADPDALDVLVPPMLVQPLVENAVRHGLAPTRKGGTVRVEARRVGDAVHVLVRDDGAGPSVPTWRLLPQGAASRSEASAGPASASPVPASRSGRGRLARGRRACQHRRPAARAHRGRARARRAELGRRPSAGVRGAVHRPGQSMTRALIVDDEAPARKVVRRALAALDAPVRVVGECADGPEAVEAVAQADADGAPVDLLFLDVQMPGLSGFEVLHEIAARDLPVPRVVFSTAFDQHAVRAFEVAAVDYLLKPFTRARFAEAVARALDADDASASRAVQQAAPYPARLLVEDGGVYVPVPVDDVLWVEAAGNYARLHTRGKTYLASQGIGALAERLDPARFARVHRSVVVAFGALRALERDNSGGFTARLVDGAVVRVSRTYADAVRQMMA